MSDTTTTPPGWYPDVQVPGGERWWDGIGWTEYRRAAQPVVPAYPSYPPAFAPGQPVPLWAPLYGATMGQAWQRFWRKYADFSGRASRSEYWFAYLWLMILVFGAYLALAVLGGIVGAIASGTSEAPGAVIGATTGLFGLVFLAGYIAVLVPFVAVSVRRLHDAGYPGTYFLLGFIPLVGGILLLVFHVTESRPAGAVYDRPTA